MSETRATVETEAEAREWELNRVAWNLPRDVNATPAPPKRSPEAPNERTELGDPADEATIEP